MSTTTYLTTLSDIAIPNTQNLLIRSLLDRLQYYDPDGHAKQLGISPALWPLFGLLWPSAIHLAGHIALRPVCQNETILEIGCGLALSSMVAHRRGARITASDRHPMTHEFLLENLQLNSLPASLCYLHGQWGLQTPLTAEQAGRAVLSERYDLIIGSDLLYERDTPPALARFIDQHAQASAEVWIVDANRGYRPAFNRHMADYGFTAAEEIKLTQNPPTEQGQKPYKGRLLKYQRL